MAAAIKTMLSGRNKLVINVTGAFSAADETDTVIIDKSTLVGPDGTEPGKIRVDEITWSVGLGFDYVLLEWDHATDDVLDYFQGQGYMDYGIYGGKTDPGSAGGTGDLILTTAGGAAGDTYSFLIACTLKD
jgi:hypothetical protein